MGEKIRKKALGNPKGKCANCRRKIDYQDEFYSYCGGKEYRVDNGI